MAELVSRDNLGAWVLKCNPAVWDLERFLEVGGDNITDWSVQENYRSDLMRKGDPVVFWVAGKREGDPVFRGLWGVGRLAGEPQMNPAGEQDPDDSLWLDLEKEATHDYGVLADLPLLEEPIPADVLENDPVLRDCEIFRAQQVGNPSFLTKQEYESLQQILSTYQPEDGEDTVTVGKKGAGFGDAETNKKVEDAAMQAVTEHLESEGYVVRNVAKHKVGWDLAAYRKDDQDLRLVEVKGVAGAKKKVLLTANEVIRAEETSEWQLAVVTDALSDPKVTFYAPEVLEEATALLWQVDLTGLASLNESPEP